MRRATKAKRGRELKGSGDEFESLFNLLPDFVVVVDGKGKILAVNDSVEKLGLFKKEELIGKNFLTTGILAAKSRPTVIRNLAKRMARAQIPPYEVELTKRDGEKIWGDVNATRIRYRGKPANLAVFRDITERKKMEEALRESEEKLRSVFASSPDAIIVSDLNTNILECNQATLDALGYSSKGELIGKSSFALIAEQDHERAMNNLRKTLEQDSAKNLEYICVAKDGREFPAELSASVIKDSSGKPVALMAIAKDITERKRMEEELRGSEERFRRIFHASPIACGVSSLEGPILDVNDAWVRLFGYSREEAIGHSTIELGMVPDLGQRDRIVKDLLEKRRLSNVEVTRRTKSGELRDLLFTLEYIELDGQQCMLNMLLDITDRKRIENELKQSEEKYRSLAENLSECVYRADPKTFAATYVNKALEEVYGYTVEEWLRNPELWEDSIHPDDKERAFAELAEAQAKMEPKILEYRIVRKDGTLRWVEDHINWEKDPEGKPVSLNGVMYDITERKQAEQAMEESEAKLKALHRHAIHLSESSGVEEVVENTLDAIEFTLGFSLAEFKLVEEGYLRLKGSRGGLVALPEVPLDGPGVTVKAANTKRTIRVPDVRKEPAFVAPKMPSGEEADRILSEMAVPVLVDDEAAAILNMESTRLDAFTDEDQRLLETLAMHVSSALARLRQVHRLEDLVEERTRGLKESETKFRRIYEASLNAIYTTTIDGQILDVNPAGVSMLGYESLDELRKVNMERVYVNVEDRRRMTELAGHGPVRDFETRFKRKDGEIIDVILNSYPLKDESGRIVGFQGTVTDITKRKRAEEAFRQSEQRLRSAFETMTEGVVVVSPNGQITRANTAAEQILGLSRSEIESRNHVGPEWEILRPDGTLMPPEEMAGPRAMKENRPVKNVVMGVKRPDGSVSWIDVSASPMMNEAGRLEGVVGTFVDVTERRQMEERLREAERLAAIGETAAMVGHDLRNPLQAVTNSAYLAKKELEDAEVEGVKKSLETIEEQVWYMDKIVSDLQEYASPLKPKCVETSLRRLVDETISTITIPENIEVSVKIAEDFPKLAVDPALMRRVFTNLATNALQAMPDGGELTIEASKTEGAVIVSFHDTGAGIPKDLFNKLFTPLFTTKAKGQGFGLAVVKRVVEAHNGTITVESSPGKGSTFTVKLPLKPAEERR